MANDTSAEPIISLDPSWPKMSLAAATAALTVAGSQFEMDQIAIDGISTRIWKNTPHDLGILLDLSRAHGDRLFTMLDDERISYEANWRATAALAHALQAMGVEKGDCVAFAMRNLPEWPVIFMAITSIGGIAVPLNAWWTGGELLYGIQDSGAKIIIMDAERYDRMQPHVDDLGGRAQIIITRAAQLAQGAMALEDIIGPPSRWAGLADKPRPTVDLASDDAATIFYTSGTTGRPKGALGSHRNLLTNILSGGFAAARGSLRRGEAPPASTPKTVLLVIPMFHVTACSATLMGSLVAGNSIIFMRKWETVPAMEIIQREKVNVTGGVPTIAWQLIEHPARGEYDLSSLEAIGYGGAPSAPELVKRIYEEFGALPGNGWGMTETMATVTSHSAEDYFNRPQSAGPAVPVADIEIRADDGVTVLPVGTVGELWARGPMVVKGYWNKPEASAETFVNGWVRTGDLARIDDEGFVFIVDRAKDMVIRGGENIYSSEVENILYAHPAVTDCAVIGIPHRTLGEEPAAVVHLAPNMIANEAELQAWVRQHLAAFKVPVAIKFVTDTLPRNANGKILKKELRAFFAPEEVAGG
ncbi:class I adenylate-forming enzyme family protein [Sphingopyxis yananensis]|uniref:class I adenylate-forming enzyme family protein n=1 Tax=Sphingopyxis yananensis TaxID=2886687 RepID=UPI001D11B71D|nr:class I adenylate-forming enzyme family protein [Sphingopyxis yananensis]MCC2601978.1 acyl--CoA ligase [Sphingopyxis yananensis]